MARQKKTQNVETVDSKVTPVTTNTTVPVENKSTEKKTVKKVTKAAKAPKKVKFVKDENIEKKCSCCCDVSSISSNDKNLPVYNELYAMVLNMEAENMARRATILRTLADMQVSQAAISKFEENFKLEGKLVKSELVKSLLTRFKSQAELLNNRILALDMFLHADAFVFDKSIGE